MKKNNVNKQFLLQSVKSSAIIKEANSNPNEASASLKDLMMRFEDENDEEDK